MLIHFPDSNSIHSESRVIVIPLMMSEFEKFMNEVDLRYSISESNKPTIDKISVAILKKNLFLIEN